MEFDPSRRLFLRRGGLAAIVPVIAPVLPIEKVVKYFFAPAGGWRAAALYSFSSRDLLESIEEEFSRIAKIRPKIGSTLYLPRPRRFSA